MKKLKIFFSGSKGLFVNIMRLNKLFWNDIKKYIIILYLIVIFDIVFNFIARWSQALIINNLTLVATWKNIERNTIIILVVVLAVSLIMPSFINILKSFYQTVLWRKIDELINIKFIRKKASFDLSQLENPTNTTLFQKVQETMWRFRNYFWWQFEISTYALNILVILFTILFIKPIISVVIIFFTIPELISKLKLSKAIWTIDNLHWPTKKKYQYLRQLFWRQNSIMDIKLSWNIDFFIGKVIKIITPFLSEQYNNDRNKAKRSIITVLSSKIGIMLSIIMLVYSVYNWNMQIGTFVFLYWSIVSFQTSLSWFFWSIVASYEDNLYVDDYFKVQDMKNEMKYNDNPIVLKPDKTPIIEFKNVSFTYPDKDKEILHKLNLAINPWEKIAIIWVNWAGKSTLVKLLTRFHDVSDWEILIDWINIKDIDLSSWWRQIWYMQQDMTNYLFETRQSIAMSDTSKRIDMKKVEKAAKMSLADEFISDFKWWYNQQLWIDFEDWEWLSGWQWQRVNLARIFYKEPQVYILDEPTSAMDAEAEAKIFDTLAHLPKDKTVIFISHRFSTIRQADRICLIEDGKITELGTHKELINNWKTYKRLFELQAKGYE